MGIQAVILNAAALAAALGATPAQETVTQTILVHDLAAVPTDMLTRAEEETDRIFALANVRLAWLYCPAVAGQRCPEHPDGTIVLRIVPGTLDFLGASALGYALLTERDAVLATISFRRVELRVATQVTSAATVGQLLGHAMAHELGHILLGSYGHSVAGLMRADWDARVLHEMSKGSLSFSRSQAARIREAAIRRAQSAAPLSRGGG